METLRSCRRERRVRVLYEEAPSFRPGPRARVRPCLDGIAVRRDERGAVDGGVGAAHLNAGPVLHSFPYHHHISRLLVLSLNHSSY